MKQAKSVSVNLGLDFGMGEVAAVATGGASGSCVSFSSMPRNGGVDASEAYGIGAGKRPKLVSVDGVAFYTGAAAPDWGKPTISRSSTRLGLDPEYEAIVVSALHDLSLNGGGTKFATVAIGLPNMVATNKTTREAVGRKIRERLAGSKSWLIDGKDFYTEIDQISFAPQAVGAFIAEGSPTGTVCVITIGRNTIERMIMRDGMPIPDSLGSSEFGVRALVSIMTGQSNVADIVGTENKIRSGRVSPAHLQQWAAAIADNLNETLGGYLQQSDGVVVAGGGAVLLADILPSLIPGIRIANNPTMSVANGLLAYATKLSRK